MKIYYALKTIIRKLIKNWDTWLQLAIYISASLILIGAISIYYDDFLNLIWSNLIFKFLVSIVLLICVLFLTNKARKKFSKISVPDEKDLTERSFKALIQPISKFSNPKNEILSVIKKNDFLCLRYKINNTCANKFEEEEKNVRIDEIENVIVKDKNKGRENFKNWQPPLVSILRNLKIDNEKGGIEQLWPLGSTDMTVNPEKKQNENSGSNKADEEPKIIKGSARELKFFVQILLFFFKDKFDIYVFDHKNNKKIKIDESNVGKLSEDQFIDNIALDFNDFKKIHETFKKIISKIIETNNEDEEDYSSHKSHKRIKEHEIAIDITGGQKPISVAGAVSTLEYKTKIIYVDTNNIPKIKEIDATIENESEL